MADSKFDASWWNIWEMRKQSKKIAEEQGLTSKGDIDSFRHPYSSAKVADAFDTNRSLSVNENKSSLQAMLETMFSTLDTNGTPSVGENKSSIQSMIKGMFSTDAGIDGNDGKTISRALGLGNELLGIGNSAEDHLADIGNNEIGLAIRDEVDRDIQRLREEWNMNDAQTEEWRERLLRTRIADAVKEGKLTQKPYSRTRSEE